MTTATPTWQDLFREQRHALLGQRAKEHHRGEVRSLGDDEILLLGGASEAARLSARPKSDAARPPLAVALTPQGKGQSLDSFQSLLAETRAAHPGAELAGFGPLDAPLEQRYQGLDRAVVMAGKVSRGFEVATELEASGTLPLPITAVLVYSPDLTVEALEQAARALCSLPNLVSVVPLPAGAGDRIPLPNLTTAGSIDAMVTSVLRLLLPPAVRVRSSWAALGWKVAQVALAYGADEMAGWTAAETLAYSGRVRAASRVERKELEEGLEESRLHAVAWPAPTRGGGR